MSNQNTTVDLTQRAPRSPRVRLGGFVMLARILDKGRAAAVGKLGEFRFDGTGIDRHFLNFVGLEFEALRDEIGRGGSDSDLLAWVMANGKTPRAPWEIAAWNCFHENRGADSDAETLTYFRDAVSKFTTTREDIRTWFDLIDLDDHCTFGGRP